MRSVQWLLSSLLTLVLFSALSPAQSIHVIDNGGQVYNVKAYGAVGNGTANDEPALNSVISICNSNGGTIYLPIGTYLVTAALNPITNRGCGIRGENQQGSIIEATSALGSPLVLIEMGETGASYRQGSFADFSIDGNPVASGTSSTGIVNTCLNLQDTQMTTWVNVSFSNCLVGVEEDLVSQPSSERNNFTNCNFYNNLTTFWMDGSTPGHTGFGHFNIVGSTVTTNGSAATQYVMHLTGGAQIYASSIQLNGNIYGSDVTLFELDGGAAIALNTEIQMYAESDIAAGYNQYAFGESGTFASGANGCGGTDACVDAFGKIYGYTAWTNPADTTWSWVRVNPAGAGGTQFMGTLTFTSATSDTLTNIQIPYQPTCFAVPTSPASAVAGVYLSESPGEINEATVYHPTSASSGTVGIYCN